MLGCSFGGWAVFRLGAQVYLPDGTVKEAKDTTAEEGAIPLVDAISTAHPSWLTKEEIAATRVPTQIIAPEHDMQLTPELRKYANETVPALGVEYDYRYFPGMIHAFATKAEEKVPGEKQAANRAKRAVSSWFLQILKD
jgi:dienelactone hydrolase